MSLLDLLKALIAGSLENSAEEPQDPEGMCPRGQECVRDLEAQGLPRQEAIEECCRRGGHQPGDGISPARPQRRR